jgi:hypothetical protein
MTYTGKEHPTLIAGAVALAMFGYAAVKARLSTEETEQVGAEAIAMFPHHNAEEIGILLQVMKEIAEEAMER